MDARIYKPGKTAMQSGHANTGEWILEFESSTSRKPEPLMGWVSAGDTASTLKTLNFPSLDEAKVYAARKGLNVTILNPRVRKVKPRNYVDNFRYRPEDEA